MGRKSDPGIYKELMSFLQVFFATNNYAPSYGEIIANTRLSSKCQVRPYINLLIHDGLVRQGTGKARTISLTEKGLSYPNRPRQRVATYVSRAARIHASAVERLVSLPVVGRTFAGQTTPISNGDFANVDEYTTIEVSQDDLPPRAKRDELFVLEVSGDSMIDARIYDGDFIICRKSDDAENHQMVVALLTDTNETTLKYFFREKGRIRLQPANSTMPPILIYDPSHLIIQGVVVQVVHCYYPEARPG